MKHVSNSRGRIRCHEHAYSVFNEINNGRLYVKSRTLFSNLLDRIFILTARYTNTATPEPFMSDTIRDHQNWLFILFCGGWHRRRYVDCGGSWSSTRSGDPLLSKDFVARDLVVVEPWTEIPPMFRSVAQLHATLFMGLASLHAQADDEPGPHQTHHQLSDKSSR